MERKINTREALDIANRFLRCQRQLNTCSKDCEKCSNDYTQEELIKAVKHLSLIAGGKQQ